MFFLEYPFMTVAGFTTLCQKLYFPTEAYSIGAFLTVNCGLHYLFRYCEPALYHSVGLSEADVASDVKLCKANIEEASKNLRLCLSPSLENIEALLLAVCTLFAVKKQVSC
jgi:hypothetical protein